MNVSVTEAINALTESNRIKENSLEGERSRRRSKREIGIRSEVIGDRNTKRIRQLLITVVRIRAEVVKASQTKSSPHASESPTLLTDARICHDSAVHLNLHR